MMRQSSQKPDFGLQLLRLRYGLEQRWFRRRGRARSLDMFTLIDFYQNIWASAAATLSAEMVEIDRGIWQVRKDRSSTLIHNYIVQIDDPVVLNIAGDKALCYRLLLKKGLPVPEYTQYTLQEIEKARQFTERYKGWHFVIKPAAGTSGSRGITTHIRTFKECRRASALASLYSTRLLIERWIPGESYRLLFLNGEMIHASRRRGMWIIGDGRSTIQHLVMQQHPADEKGDNGVRSSRAVLDRQATLQSQGLHETSIPPSGQRVLVQSALDLPNQDAEVRCVFNEDATHVISPALKEQAARAVRTLDSRFAGVDLITLDPTQLLEKSGGVINEINTTPGLHHHYNLVNTTGETHPAVDVLRYLLHKGPSG